MSILTKAKWAAAIFGALAFLSFAAGCAKAESTGYAYALTGGGNYVGMAKITLTNGKITSLSLEEVQLPDSIKAGETVLPSGGGLNGEEVPASDTVKGDDGNSYYKKVIYGDATLIYNASQGYMFGDIPILEYLADPENAAEYVTAVLENKVAVEVNGEANYSVMTRSSLSKAEASYWIRTDKNGEEYSRWLYNRNATINYVLKYGVDNLSKLTRSQNAANDAMEDMEVYYWTDENVSTGATWNCLNPANPQGYVSYAQLILNAYSSAK